MNSNQNCLDAKISVVINQSDVEPVGAITVREFLAKIRDPKAGHVSKIEKIRELSALSKTKKDKHDIAASKIKDTLPSVTLSGEITAGKRAKAMQEGRMAHSGLIQLDIDAKDIGERDPLAVRDEIGKDEHVLAAFLSPSGKGVKALVRVPQCATDEQHKDAWQSMSEYFSNTYGLEADTSTKDSGRMFYLSHDPHCIDKVTARELPIIVKPKEKKAEPPQLRNDSNFTLSDLAGMIAKIPRPVYADWLAICSGAWNTFGHDATPILAARWGEDEAGEYDRKYSQRTSEHTIATVIHHAKMHGWQKPRRTLESYLVNHGDTVGMSWEQIDTLRPPYVVEGFGRRGELMLCAAESKSRKSWLVQDLGFCVAIGEPWLAREDGTGGFATAQARVFVFDLELSDGEMRFRFAKARGNRTSDISEQKELTNQFVHYSLEDVQTEDISYLLDELKSKVSPGDLVIVDCLYRLHPDGNETKEIAEAFTMLKKFAKETQSLVVIVDHFRKAGADKAKDRIAGTFVKSASASTIVAIQTNAEKVLELSIDARTFHGNDKVCCRFNMDNYRFESVAEEYATVSTVDEYTRYLLDLWQSHDHGASVTTNSAKAKWALDHRQTTANRLEKLEKLTWITSKSQGKGKERHYYLTGRGVDVIKEANRVASSLATGKPQQAEMLVEYKKNK